MNLTNRSNSPTIIVSVAFTLALFSLSFWVPGKIHYYLLWNLVLAMIPLLLANGIAGLFEHQRRLRALMVILGLLWLVFLPNSFYLITDFLHIENSSFQNNYSTAPQQIAFSEIFNLILFASFIWTGYLCGFVSVRKIHRVIDQVFGTMAGFGAVVGAFLMSSVGVYIGRVIRLNSWDVFVSPLQTFHRITDPALNFRPIEVLVFLGLFTGLLWVIYSTLYQNSPGPSKTLRPGLED